jgi:hypothetical protein
MSVCHMSNAFGSSVQRAVREERCLPSDGVELCSSGMRTGLLAEMTRAVNSRPILAWPVVAQFAGELWVDCLS